MAGPYPEWVEKLQGAVSRALEDDMPAWLRGAARPAGTGGHRAGAAEKQAVYARFVAMRDADRATSARPPVFASMRGPDDVSPLVRKIFGAGR
jgi:hypothetical protein